MYPNKRIKNDFIAILRLIRIISNKEFKEFQNKHNDNAHYLNKLFDIRDLNKN